MSRFLAAVVVVLAACSGGDGPTPPAGRDAGRATKRVIEPPAGKVRPLPPHAIDVGGVGPYRLGATRTEIATLLTIPRVAILDIRGVVDASVVRAENDAILIGGRRDEATSFTAASFIAVLAKEIGGTEGGITVGARRAALDALGAAVVEPTVARDPDIDVRAAMPGVWFLLRDGVVRAILLNAREPVAAAPAARGDAGVGSDAGAAVSPTGCVRPEPMAAAAARSAAQLATVRQTLGGCFEGAAQTLVVGVDELAIVDEVRARRVAHVELAGLLWAAPLRVEGGRDDIVAVTQRLTADELIVSLIAMRLDGGRLVRVAEDAVYRLSRNEGQWIGASLADLTLFVTVEARAGGFAVGGALVHGGSAQLREVAPLLPVTVPRRRRGGAAEPAAPPVDAGPRDAGGADAPAGHDAHRPRRERDAGPRDAGPRDASDK